MNLKKIDVIVDTFNNLPTETRLEDLKWIRPILIKHGHLDEINTAFGNYMNRGAYKIVLADRHPMMDEFKKWAKDN